MLQKFFKFLLPFLIPIMTFPTSAQDIRITLQLPLEHHLGANLKHWKHCVTQQTSDFDIQIFASAKLFKDDEVPLAVGSGAIEMGTASLTRFASFVPAVDAIYIPFLFDDPEKLKQASAPGSEIRTLLDKAILQATGARILWWQAFGRTVYLSKDKPLLLPDDIRGLRIRTFGNVAGWSIEKFGGFPILISGSKQYSAYLKGAVDGAITGITTVKVRNLHQVMRYMTLTYDSAIEFVTTINQKFFQSLPLQAQTILVKCAQKVEKILRDTIYSKETAALEALKTKMTVIDLNPAQRAYWQNKTESLINRFIMQGGDYAAKVIEAASKL